MWNMRGTQNRKEAGRSIGESTCGNKIIFNYAKEWDRQYLFELQLSVWLIKIKTRNITHEGISIMHQISDGLLSD